MNQRAGFYVNNNRTELGPIKMRFLRAVAIFRRTDYIEVSINF
jgi:hypothetical protein